MDAPEIGIPKSKGGNSRDLSGIFNVPQSCCKEPQSQECKDNIRNINPNNINNNVIYTQVRGVHVTTQNIHHYNIIE